VEISEFSLPVIGDFPLMSEPVYYVEGFSPVVDMLEGGGPWFCFEAPFVEAAMELQKLGFTAKQILDARERDRREVEV